MSELSCLYLESIVSTLGWVIPVVTYITYHSFLHYKVFSSLSVSDPDSIRSVDPDLGGQKWRTKIYGNTWLNKRAREKQMHRMYGTVLYLIIDTFTTTKWKGLKCRVSDPYSFDTDPDPAFYVEYRSGSNTNLGFLWQKIEKNLQRKKTILFFGSKTTIYLSLYLHKERPS